MAAREGEERETYSSSGWFGVDIQSKVNGLSD